MNKYIIIRSDTKSISLPMSQKEVIKKIQTYEKQGIPSLIIYDKKYANLTPLKN